MPGFTGISQIITALSTGKGQEKPFNKQAPTSTAGSFHSLWRVAGIPGAGGDPTSLTATQYSSSSAGAFSFANPTSPATLHLINAWGTSATAGAMGTLIVLDRLMGYGNLNMNVNTAQNMTNSVGLPRYTTGEGVMMFLEITTAPGATAHNATITYTNQAGTGSRSTGAQACVVSSAANRIPNNFLYFPLQAGDTGVRSVQTFQLSAASGSAGVANLILAKPLFSIPLALVGVKNDVDLTMQMPSVPKLEDNHCLMFIFVAPAAATTPTFFGQIRSAEN